MLKIEQSRQICQIALNEHVKGKHRINLTWPNTRAFAPVKKKIVPIIWKINLHSMFFNALSSEFEIWLPMVKGFETWIESCSQWLEDFLLSIAKRSFFLINILFFCFCLEGCTYIQTCIRWPFLRPLKSGCLGQVIVI